MYVFMGDVEQENIKPIVEWILHENHVVKKKRKELLLMVCSEGGDMGAAFALIDVMHSSVIPVKTVGLGVIASAGLLIFIAGHRGRRVLTPNTSILSHQFSWSSEGKAHELFATMREFELTQARMLAHYETCTGLGPEQIRKHLLPPQDIWLSAEEALALGICDHVSAVTKN
jgi:ATP-dependent Clp protease protease subunit